MLVQVERDINTERLLKQLQNKINNCVQYKTEVNQQLLIDCYDVIKAKAAEEDDAK